MRLIIRYACVVTCLCVAASLAEAAQPAGLLAEWNFDEGKGDVARDSSGNNRDLRLSDVSWVKAGAGYALKFAGPRSVAKMTRTSPLGLTGAVSVSLWIKPAAPQSAVTPLFGSGISGFLMTQYAKDNVFWYIGSGGNKISAKIKLREWNHVVATFDGKRMAIWVNGKQIIGKKSRHASYRKVDRVNFAGKSVGKYEGHIDDARLYARAISKKEIRRLFLAGAAGHGMKLASGAPPVSQKDAVAFFRGHPGKVAYKELANGILFANDKVGLAFRKFAGGFALDSLYGIEQKQEYLGGQDALSIPDLFEVSMTLDPIYVGRDDRLLVKKGLFGIVDEMAGDAFPVGSQKAKSTAWKVEETENGSVLTLEWKGLDARENKGALDVTATIRLRAGDPLAYFRINVKNRSKRYGIERINFPIVNFAPIGSAEETYFVLPRGRGSLVKNPFTSATSFGNRYSVVGAFYPNDINMQFHALYNGENLNGVYFGTQDPVPNMTNSKYLNSAEVFTWKLAHFPPNIAFAGDPYNQPYDCVIGPYTGDWYDAAMRYRKWALKQSWARKGPLSHRKDMPKWFPESPLTFYSMTNDSATGTHNPAENLQIAAEAFEEWLDWAGVPMMMNFYGWQEYRPLNTVASLPFNPRRLKTDPSSRWYNLPSTYEPSGNYPKLPALKEFASTLARLRKKGGMVCPYIGLEIFDPGPTNNNPYAAEADPFIVRDLYGAKRMWASLHYWQPCAHTAWWQNRLGETAELMAKNENIGGLYLDVMQGSAIPCYWIAHGHSAGGGHSATLGMHKLCEVIYERMKAVAPDTITTGENMAENMIDVTDGNLTFVLWPENKAPIFAAVYQDYIVSYGLEMSTGAGYQGRFKDTYREDAFFLEAAALFTEGSKVGRIRLRPRSSQLSVNDPRHKAMVDFLAQVVGYYKQEDAKKLLAYGRLLRPLEFTAPAEMPRITYTAAMYAQYPTQFPALTSGVFLAEDGTVGVFIVNTSRKELAYAADLDLQRYGIDTTQARKLTQISPDGAKRTVKDKVTGKITLQGKLAARSITMYLLQ